MNYYINILHGFLTVQKMERFQFGLVKRASVRMVRSVRHFENLTLWIQLLLGLRDRA